MIDGSRLHSFNGPCATLAAGLRQRGSLGCWPEDMNAQLFLSRKTGGKNLFNPKKKCNKKKTLGSFRIYIHTRIAHHQTSFDNPARRCFASELRRLTSTATEVVGARPVFKSGAFGGQDFTFNDHKTVGKLSHFNTTKGTNTNG